MSSWLVLPSTDQKLQYIERASPARMAARFPGQTFINARGNATSTPFALHNPDITSVRGHPLKYWKVTGQTVSLMNSLERQAVDDAAAAAQESADAAANRARLSDERVLLAITLVLKDEINILRGQHGLAPRTNGQIRTAIENRIDSLPAGASIFRAGRR